MIESHPINYLVQNIGTPLAWLRIFGLLGLVGAAISGFDQGGLEGMLVGAFVGAVIGSIAGLMLGTIAWLLMRLVALVTNQGPGEPLGP
jgi:hypothetical protein